MGPPPPQPKIPEFGPGRPRDPKNRVPRVFFMKIRPGGRSGDLNRTYFEPKRGLAHVCSSLPRKRLGGTCRGAGDAQGDLLLGKLEHTWDTPRSGRKSVRFRSPDLHPGRIFMKRTRGIRFLGSRGRWEPNWGILSWGVGGPRML